MNNKIVIIIIAFFLLGVGGFYFLNSRKGINIDNKSKPVAQSHRSYQIEVVSNTSNIQPKQKATIKYKIQNDKGEILKNYEIVHEKIMHFIAVRKDLQYFQHLHPDFNQATGEFAVDIIFQIDGQYRIFPDFTPGLDNPQKLPATVYHDIDVGNSNEYYAQNVIPDNEQTKIYGDYKITTTFPKDTKKQQGVTFSLNITKADKPVTDLDNYLGALGHSVILKEETLDFIHTHALEAKGSSSNQGHGTQQVEHSSQTNTTEKGPEISFETTFPESGVYKIFTQFQHEGEVQTVDYIVKVY